MEVTERGILESIAAQLRKPQGKIGVEVGKMMNLGNESMILHTMAVLKPSPKDSILEIGMGNGFFVKNIVCMDSSIQYVGCDVSELMVRESKKNNTAFKRQVNFVLANAEKLPFANRSFTKILTINTLYFWEDKGKVFRELKRVLKPKGTLIVSIRPKHNLEKFSFTRYGFSMFSKKELQELLITHGFRCLETTEVVEPSQERWGEVLERETLIISCKKPL